MFDNYNSVQIISIVIIGCGLIEGQQLSFTQNQVPIEGDSCYHYGRRVYGICQNQINCQEAIDDFQRRGINPQICSYRGYTPILCCPPSVRPQTVTVTAQPTRQPSDITPNVVQQQLPNDSTASFSRISEQKCHQYAKLTMESNVVGSFSLDEPIQHTVETSKCKYSVGGGFIVGGTVTKPGEFPHMALIGWQERDSTVDWKCGGTLISYHFVLTAAHCASNRGIEPNVIRLGEQDYSRTNNGADPQDYSILRVKKHPGFRSSSKYNDIALIQLSQRARMSDYTRPACLWQSHSVNHPHVTATGWGRINNRGDSSTELLKVSLKMITNDQCNTVYNHQFSALRQGIIDSQICAGDDSEEKDTCQGDSGNYEK